MLITLQNHREQIDRLATLTGFVDAAVSVACFRASLPYYALPEFSEEKSTGKGDRGSASCFEADELYHPLLEDPIPNSLSTSGWILLTGSNASGKSTFLKASALCALLSQTVLTAPAKKYRGSYFRIYTSMALRDNLTGGESYFIVEIKSLKRILDAGKEKREDKAPVLCFIDEVLRGTNTVERIAASSEILASLRQSGIRCFAATHDVELTDLLSQAYENYHFEEQIEKGDVIFNYRLQKGKASSRNAIRLLEAIGYDEKIVRSAEKRAETFIGTGVWKKPAAAGDAG
jgi:DNA mismatch repair ATPase MutS